MKPPTQRRDALNSDRLSLLGALRAFRSGDFSVRLPLFRTLEYRQLADEINALIADLVRPTKEVSRVIGAVAKGDLSHKIPMDIRGMPIKGEFLKTAKTVNTMVDQLGSFASEVTRVAREVGTEGKLGGQAQVKGVSGTWKDLTDNVNTMASNLTNQVRNIAQVTTAVAKGDLSKKITVVVRGEILELKNTINAMVDQLGSFASEVTRVAREVGTEGKLGGQAQVKGVSGTWEDLTDNVNTMASNLTNQVRNIAEVVTAVANGNLRRKLVLEARGEIAALAETINGMIDTLAIFADQVTTVAREVGTEGKLGGQAKVPGTTGIWKDLTQNVNQLAANLTSQVRAIGEVATAVTKGDLTRSIAVEAKGEVLALKDNINEMIRNLRETTRKNVEQDWLKTNLAKFASMLQGERDLRTVCQKIMSELASMISAQHGVIYINISDNNEAKLRLLASYAHSKSNKYPEIFDVGEGLIGQCAYEKRRILLSQVPGNYVKIRSGLGEAVPNNLVALPVLFEGQVKAVIEMASFNTFTEVQLALMDQLTESIGVVLNTIAATMRTETLLAQSQSLTEQLQKKQQELQEKNQDLEEKAGLLSVQKKEVESKNREIEQARQALQERAEQLAMTSKYKSQFLANMSHELRTPLNSLLLLARQLADNQERNLTSKQIEYAQVICSAGNDLLVLINDILDLSKIEAGAMTIDLQPMYLSNLRDHLERSFRQVAQEKKLGFKIELAEGLPETFDTDPKRLQQILRNLLSNAFKFTEKGQVVVHVNTVEASAAHEAFRSVGPLIAFSVRDTGIGIPKEKQAIIFEAFQQVDAGIDRRYGGTGLGLTISREIARLLGGEIHVESIPSAGSKFTLYLPLTYAFSLPPKRKVGQEAAESAMRDGSIASNDFKDDRGSIGTGDRTLLIVEDDATFARILLDLAREKGFKGIVALQGETGLALLRDMRPKAAILDLRLPDMTGWMLLDAIKHDRHIRHIPVLIISGLPDEGQHALRLGALGYLEKPASREELLRGLSALTAFLESPTKRLLVVDQDERRSRAIVDLIGNGDVATVCAASRLRALDLLKSQRFDCAILEADLPEMPEFIQNLNAEPALSRLPILIYADKKIAKMEAANLHQASRTAIAKVVLSPEHLLDEADLFLHRDESRLPKSKKKLLARIHQADPVLAGKKVLVVDDDIRNLFSVTSILESRKMKTLNADNGKSAIDILEKTPDIDVVLMDVMMPEMDGYQAMRTIRRMAPPYQSLPIIALTAKAMKEDREKCIQAGASDYIPKPVDVERLLAVLRVWLT